MTANLYSGMPATRHISSAALTNCSVIAAMAGTPCRSAAIESCKLHDEQLPIADACDNGIPFRNFIDDVGIGRRAVVRLLAPYDVSYSELLAQHAFELREVALGSLFAVGDETDGLSL
jgi:hypothetical protein